MTLQKIIVGSFILFIPNLGLTQKEYTVSYRKQLKNEAEFQIKQLHDGVLFVRLTTKKNSIQAIRDAGNNKLADKVESKQAEINKKIILAFQNYFDFCPAYFFFSDFSKQVSERKFDKVEFLNENLLPDTSVHLDNPSFLTAQFATLQQDTTKYFDGYYYVQNENGREQRTGYHSGTNMTFGALIIRSDQFIQLRKPFPFYVRTFDSMPIRRNKNWTVKKMNRQLHFFYKRKIK